MPSGEPPLGEITPLKKYAGFVVSWLVLMTLISLGFAVVLFACPALDTNPAGGGRIWCAASRLVLLCVTAGTLGSSISALISAADRISHGWELPNGEKYPIPGPNEPKDMFVAKMVPWFVVRPLLGSAMGIVIYAGLTGGYLIAVKDAKQESFSPEGLFFLAFLAGLFAKTFIEKLKVTFDTLFSAPNVKGKDKDKDKDKN